MLGGFQKFYAWTGASDPGGSGGVGPPLESGIYVIKKNFEKLFLFIGTPLDKNRSVAPANLGKNDFSPKKFLTIDYIDK